MKVGDKIAQRKVTIQDGNEVTFPELRKKYILFFYPKDNTPGCTAETCSFRDAYSALKKKGYELYGVSIDSIKSHQKFIENHQLPFPIISDHEKLMVAEFGLWVKKKFMGREYMGTARTTYIIDEKSAITHIIDKVDTKEAAEQILQLI
jgi:peroxiredoxin Q/BCP